MAIYYQNDGVSLPQVKRRLISNWIKDTAAKYNKRVGDISYIFCSDEKILSVNREYLKHDYYTDIITFDYSEGDTISGDIFVSLDTVKSNSEQYGSAYADELNRVIIHGILHLCGFKDKSEEEARQMRKMENEALDRLNILLTK